MSLEVRALGHRYGSVTALQELSLRIDDGEIVAVLGPSGSGKTTLLEILAGLLPPAAGEVLLDGRTISRAGWALAPERRNIGFVFQDFALWPHMTVAETIAFPLAMRHLPAAERQERVAQVLELVQLEGYGRRYPHELSGGQRQRVAIARALAVQPRVLVADEPVSMLDVSIRLGVLNLLADLRDRDELAILYITHDIASARYLADRIVVMYAGQVVESGPAVEVTDAPAHPYTQLLLSAAPDPQRVTPVALRGAGAPPSAVAPPSGCRFRLRCPYAMAICAEQAPPAFPAGNGHESACWLLGEGNESSAAHGQGTKPVPATTSAGEATSRVPALPGRRPTVPGVGEDTPDTDRGEVMSTDE